MNKLSFYMHCDTMPTVQAPYKFCLFHEVIQPLFSQTSLSRASRHRSQHCFSYTRDCVGFHKI